MSLPDTLLEAGAKALDKHGDESWRPVPGHEVYEVSDMGGVRSSVRHSRNPLGGKMTLRQSKTDSGYFSVELRDDGSRRRVAVHRLVLLAFAGPAPDHHEACHGNGVRTDNRLANLRWDTRAANYADAVRHGLRGERHNFHKLTESEVRKIRTLRSAGKTQREAGAVFGVSQAAVSHIERGNAWRWVS